MQIENGAGDDEEEDDDDDDDGGDDYDDAGDDDDDDAGDDDDECGMTMLLADLDFIGCTGNKSLLFTLSIVNFQAILVVLNHSHDFA